MTLVGFPELRQMGVPYTQTHIYRLVKAGKFPRPIKLGDAPNSRVSWVEAEVDAWIKERVAARDRSAA